jgi:hypothetical protein
MEFCPSPASAHESRSDCKLDLQVTDWATPVSTSRKPDPQDVSMTGHPAWVQTAPSPPKATNPPHPSRQAKPALCTSAPLAG